MLINSYINLEVTITLWGAKTDLIDTNKTKEKTYRVIIITSTKVNMYQVKRKKSTKLKYNQNTKGSPGLTKIKGEKLTR